MGLLKFHRYHRTEAWETNRRLTDALSNPNGMSFWDTDRLLSSKKEVICGKASIDLAGQ